MNKANYFKWALAITSLTSFKAAASEVLPMNYVQDFGGQINPAGSVVLRGADARIFNGIATATPAQVIYVAPSRLNVSGAKMQVNQAANCSVIKNDLYIEETAIASSAQDVADSHETQAILRDLKKQRLKAVQDCVAARRSNQPDAAAICAKRSEDDDLIKELEADILVVTDRFEKVADKAIKRLAGYSTEIGGYAGASMQLFDPAEIDRVRQANPGFLVQLVPMTGITFGFNAGEEASPALKAGRRTALSFYLNGENWHGNGGSPEAVTKLKTGQTASLGILLTRIGACEPSLVRTATFDYWYDGYGLLDGVVRYNKWKFYTHLDESRSEGGFFTTSTVHTVEDNLKNSEDFKVAVVGRGQDGTSDVLDMEERLANRLEAKLLRMMAEKQDNVQHTAVKAPGADGAATAGEALKKCPNQYCQIAGYALLTLDAIFGSSTSRESAQLQWDWTVSEEWSQTTVTPYPGSSSGLVNWGA